MRHSSPAPRPIAVWTSVSPVPHQEQFGDIAGIVALAVAACGVVYAVMLCNGLVQLKHNVARA